jgi:hypothetical protein
MDGAAGEATELLFNLMDARDVLRQQQTPVAGTDRPMGKENMF